MRSLAGALLVNVVAASLVAIVGVRGWQLVAVCLVLVAVYIWPKGDAAARRERRIEKQSDEFANMITDTREILSRAIEKVPPETPENLPSGMR